MYHKDQTNKQTDVSQHLFVSTVMPSLLLTKMVDKAVQFLRLMIRNCVF